MTVSEAESGRTRTAAIASLKALLDKREWAKAESEAAGLLVLYPHDPTILAACARSAVESGDHAAALARWTSCRERSLDQPLIWRLGVANALLKLGRYSEAEHEFRQGLEENGNPVATFTGLATTLGYTNPAQAEGWWLKAFEAAQRRLPIWLVIRAKSVADAGDGERAYQLLSEVFDTTPDPPAAAYHLLTRLLFETGRRAEAARQIKTGWLRAGANVLSIDRLRLQLWLQRREGARVELREALPGARTFGDLNIVFESAQFALNSYERHRAFLEIRERTAALAAANEPDALALALRLDLALRDYARYRERLAGAKRLPELWDRPLRRIGEKLCAARFPDYDAPKIFGIGLSRTGTSSLASALERLGFLHAHFLNPLTLELLRDDDFALLDSANDTPVSMRFETLYSLFPNARFILTERPFDSWRESLEAHFSRWWGTSDFKTLRQDVMRGEQSSHGEDIGRVHCALYFSHPGPREAYEAFGQRVERFFADKPANKLLRHNVFRGDGWSKLCAFVDAPTPDEPYPRLNAG